ncbi:serine hydroxymethyltransferase [Candidatus Dependentiae bacterium]|nr:serine hydroxymethyltransferase [Candidatus Dependentiae bacterium]
MLEKKDPELLCIINQELQRQENTINLIASENYVSKEILEATASVLTNKYAEGYPGRRYYGGCKIIDKAELLAIERCKKLFSAEHVNVQAHSGSQANMAVYHALLQPGDTILGMSLSEGGHLTHGHQVNFSGKLYNCIGYKVNKHTEQIDFDEIAELAHMYRPKLIVAGASAYSRTIDFVTFAQIAKDVSAYFLADIAHIAGLIAAGLHPSPIGHADVVTSTTHKTLRGPRGGLIMCTKQLGEKIDKAVMPGIQGGPFMHIIAAKAIAFYEALQSDFKEYQQQVINNAQTIAQTLEQRGYRIVAGGTDNHLLIVDVRNKNISGKDAEIILEKTGIVLNRNCIPFDPKKPWITSGIRIGTPAITTRGMKEQQAQQIAIWIDHIIQNRNNQEQLNYIKNEIKNLCTTFPIYSQYF